MLLPNLELQAECGQGVPHSFGPHSFGLSHPKGRMTQTSLGLLHQAQPANSIIRVAADRRIKEDGYEA
jgi:hypothetical protein